MASYRDPTVAVCFVGVVNVGLDLHQPIYGKITSPPKTNGNKRGTQSPKYCPTSSRPSELSLQLSKKQYTTNWGLVVDVGRLIYLNGHTHARSLRLTFFRWSVVEQLVAENSHTQLHVLNLPGPPVGRPRGLDTIFCG